MPGRGRKMWGIGGAYHAVDDSMEPLTRSQWLTVERTLAMLLLGKRRRRLCGTPQNDERGNRYPDPVSEVLAGKL